METSKKEFTPELRKRLIVTGGIAICIVAAGVTAAYFVLTAREVAIDTASIEAPLINFSATAPGRLNAVYVSAGESVAANTPLFLVGTEVVASKSAGLVVNVNDTVGAQMNAGSTIVSMIDPVQLRVVGKIDEDKGLSQITVGDAVLFTVDAFGGTKFKAVVDEVAPTSNQSDIVFSVSDKREEQTFDIKARFDTSAYPQLKNGMSARMWVYR